MKKRLVIFFALAVVFNAAIAQPIIQASIGAGSTGNSVSIYLRPSMSQSPASISTLQFNVGIPAGTNPIPTLSVTANAFAGVTWIIGAPYTEGGYINYNIYTAASPITFAATAGTEFVAMEVSFSGGPVTAQDVSLVTLPDGGTTGSQFALFYATGTTRSNGLGQLYYARAGVTLVNTVSYDPDGALPGVATSSATFTGVVLPVKLTAFNAIRKSQDGYLTWNIENQDAFTDHFEIERSTNGSEFMKIGRAEVKTNVGSQVSYDYTDRNIDNLKSAATYYRIITVHQNTAPTKSEIRKISLNEKVLAATLYPNPATDGTNLSFDLPHSSAVSIRINDASGKEVMIFQKTAAEGVNKQRINTTNLAAGKYILTIKTDTESQSIPFVKTL